MPVIIIVAPQFWHLRLSMIFSGLGINWGWGMGSSCFRRERYRALSHRRRAEGGGGDVGTFGIYPFKVWSKWITFKSNPLILKGPLRHKGIKGGQPKMLMSGTCQACGQSGHVSNFIQTPHSNF